MWYGTKQIVKIISTIKEFLAVWVYFAALGKLDLLLEIFRRFLAILTYESIKRKKNCPKDYDNNVI